MEKEIENFWLWFVDNQEIFLNGPDDDSYKYLNEIQEKLDFASNSKEYGIALEFSKLPQKAKKLEISADGVKELFDVVIQIVEAAPKLDNWEFVTAI